MRFAILSIFLIGNFLVAAEKPNIILIMADDVGYECFGCYGSEQYSTPNIDRMAAEGMRFEHCYSQPLCTPSRIKIMTGKSNVRNYSAFSVLRKDQKTFGDYLQEAGYGTAVAGKWQLYGADGYSDEFRAKGALPEETGFDTHCLWQIKTRGDRFWNPELTTDGETKQYKPEDYGPDIVTDYILDYMEAQKDGPFFVYYPMILVHNPFLPTPDSEDDNKKKKQRNFEDMVAYMDKLVGRISDKAKDLGIDKNTLILFTGDNGTNKAITSKLGDRVIQGGKGKTDNTGTRVPLVAYWPGTIKAGQVTDQLVDFSDFLPTFQQLAGAPVPEGIDGLSFAPLLKGEDGPAREAMFCYYNPRPEKTEPVLFARDQEWKLYGDGRFFRMADDPEEKNVLSPAENPKAYEKLQKVIDSMPAEGQMLLEYE